MAKLRSVALSIVKIKQKVGIKSHNLLKERKMLNNTTWREFGKQMSTSKSSMKKPHSNTHEHVGENVLRDQHKVEHAQGEEAVHRRDHIAQNEEPEKALEEESGIVEVQRPLNIDLKVGYGLNQSFLNVNLY